MAGVIERADVRMIQAGNRFCFALEALAQFRAVGKMSGKNLDGNDAIEPRVPRAIHLAHPARTNRGENFVGAEPSSCFQTHYFSPVGTFCFNSSNQFSTTLICVGDESCSMGLSIRNRWPSGDTS